MPATRYPLLVPLLRRYFYSGWAFLIPYLAAYLLYYITGWPVNPPTDPLTYSPLPLAPPPLLHLYWSLHALHLVLAAIALHSWWTESSVQYAREARNTDSAPYSSYRLHLLTRIAPWAILALLFYIPGVYLEWPSDPWEHLRRINEWRVLDTVGAHSSWHKSSYFIPYSFLSWCIGLRQLFWLDFYYTGICLLLCWQYYRLARACGLNECASMIFVILQTLLFGNNIFSFYRYYGISSSIYAQLGAVALTRIFLEWAAFGKTNLAQCLSLTAYPSYNLFISPFFSRPSFWHLPSFLWLLASGLCLLALTALNHPQGLGIASLGIAAIIVWRLIEWKRSALWWLIGGTIAVNALFLWHYPRPPIIETYRAQGWLNTWYGFNFLDLTSPAGNRILQIISGLGLANLVIAFVLLRANHVTSWLTLVPVIGFLLPCLAISLAQTAYRTGGELNVIVFQRFLFSVPYGLAIMAIFAALAQSARNGSFRFKLITTGATLAALLAFATLSSNGKSYNRLWHATAPHPTDAELIGSMTNLDQTTGLEKPVIRVQYIGPPTAQAALNIFYAKPPSVPRAIGQPSSPALTAALEMLGKTSEPEVGPFHSAAKPPYPASSKKQNDSWDFSDWEIISAERPEIAELDDPATGRRHQVLTSRPGRYTAALSPRLIPIDRRLNYRLETTVVERGPAPSTVFLAIVWYDADGRILESNRPSPEGAGNPSGWANGTHSYFGLTGKPAPLRPSTFSIEFGTGLPAIFPHNAFYFRFCALLNHSQTPGSAVQLSEVRCRTLAPPVLNPLVTSATALSTPLSQAGVLSEHWPAQQIAIDSAGMAEINSAAASLSAFLKAPPADL